MAKIDTHALFTTITDLFGNSRKPAARVLTPSSFGAQQDKSSFVAVVASSSALGFDIKLFRGRPSAKSPALLATLPYSDLVTLAGNLNSLYSSDHRNIMKDPNWQTLYGRHSRNYDVMAPSSAVSAVAEISYPCHNCGFFLPERFIQIDHHHPQFGGSNMATLKALRSFGYTKTGSSGPKGTAVGSGGYAFIPPKGGAPGSTASSTDRYSLNDKGVIAITIIDIAKEFFNLQSTCMNSVINLVPLCPTCNGAAGKWHAVKPIRP